MNTKNKESEAKAKRDKFIKFAEYRTNVAISSIKRIGNLSNKRAYEYGNDDIKKIFKFLRATLNETESKFNNIKSKDDDFRL